MNISIRLFLSSVLISSLLITTGCKLTEPDQSEIDNAKQLVALNDLIKRYEAACSENNEHLSLVLLEKIVMEHPDAPHIEDYKLALAKSYMEAEQFESAYRLYKGYTVLYPGHEQTEFAFYQAILAKYYQTLRMRVECDSTEAEKTMRLCDKYLEYNEYHEYKTHVADIKNTCQKRLLNKETYVFNNLIVQGKLTSARARLDYITSVLLPKHPELEPEVLFLECKLANAYKDKERKETIYKELNERHPDSSFTKMARGLLKSNLLA